MRRLAIINSPHPGTFLRELKSNPKQQAASAYMNELIRPDAEANLVANDFQQLFHALSEGWGGEHHPAWLTDGVKDQYRTVWSLGMTWRLQPVPRLAPASAPARGRRSRRHRVAAQHAGHPWCPRWWSGACATPRCAPS